MEREPCLLNGIQVRVYVKIHSAGKISFLEDGPVKNSIHQIAI